LFIPHDIGYKLANWTVHCVFWSPSSLTWNGRVQKQIVTEFARQEINGSKSNNASAAFNVTVRWSKVWIFKDTCNCV
jgi:hypothetical protein